MIAKNPCAEHVLPYTWPCTMFGPVEQYKVRFETGHEVFFYSVEALVEMVCDRSQGYLGYWEAFEFERKSGWVMKFREGTTQ